MSRLRFVMLLLAAATASAPAWAQRAVDVETFRPAMDGYGIFTVERAETGHQFDFGFKIFADYAHQPLHLLMRDPSGAQVDRVIMNYQVVTHLGAHFSIFNWLQLAVQIPMSAQSYSAHYGTNTDPLMPTGFYATGSRTNVSPPSAAPLDTRIALKVRTPRIGPVGFGLIAGLTVPFGDEASFLGERDFTFRPTLVGDLLYKGFTFALNVGYILRFKTVVLDPVDVAAKIATPATLIEVDDELTLSVGGAYRFGRFVGLGVELYGGFPLAVEGAPTGRTPARKDIFLDVLGGLNFFAPKGVQITIGGGAGLPIATQRRDLFRLFVGLTWTPGDGKAAVAAGGADSDGDGIPDNVDQCPKQPEDKDGFQDEDGCPDPDNDGDGILDKIDLCPNEPEDFDKFQDEDGCPDPDNDNDGVPDAIDKCPMEPEDRDGFQDDDGCPDLDNDGDGIPDNLDKCPNEPETINGIDDDDGCPDSVPGMPVAGTVDLTNVKLRFDSGKATPTVSSAAELDRVAVQLKTALQIKKIRVEGHSDDKEKKGKELSQLRAEAVRDALVKRGIEASRLSPVGYGSERPAVKVKGANDSEGRMKNRRVELIAVEQ